MIENSSVSSPDLIEPILKVFINNEEGGWTTTHGYDFNSIASEATTLVPYYSAKHSIRVEYNGDGELSLHVGTESQPDLFTNDFHFETANDILYVVGHVDAYAISGNIYVVVNSSATRNYLSKSASVSFDVED